ncbi:hypothetical protein BDR07DRAFT_1304378, partial [Suillus spraguei]
ELHSHHGVFVSVQTLLRTFRQLHLNRKHISAYALEWNKEKRAIFMNSIAEIVPDPEMLMFGDEAAKDERTVIQRYGRSRIGMRYVLPLSNPIVRFVMLHKDCSQKSDVVGLRDLKDKFLDFHGFHFLGFCFAIAFSSNLGVCIKVNNECSLEFRYGRIWWQQHCLSVNSRCTLHYYKCPLRCLWGPCPDISDKF